jgi:hypothetical protein
MTSEAGGEAAATCGIILVVISAAGVLRKETFTDAVQADYLLLRSRRTINVKPKYAQHQRGSTHYSFDPCRTSLPAFLRGTAVLAQDAGSPLASWNDGAEKQADFDFASALDGESSLLSGNDALSN